MKGSAVSTELYEKFFLAWEKGDLKGIEKWGRLLAKVGKDMDDIISSARRKGLLDDIESADDL